jgi:hyperosmotically inducible periplasmic protein
MSEHRCDPYSVGSAASLSARYRKSGRNSAVPRAQTVTPDWAGPGGLFALKPSTRKENNAMKISTSLIAVVAACTALVALQGCAVTRGQESVGAYLDDASITAAVKTSFVGNKEVDATSIKVETLNGEVLLSGFAKSSDEKSAAESIARNTKGVKAVRNQIVFAG